MNSVWLPAPHSSELPVLSGIMPPALQLEAAALVLSRKVKVREDHLLHRIATEKPPCTNLKSRYPIGEHAYHLLDSIPDDVSKQSWLRTRWAEEWLAADNTRLHTYVNTSYQFRGQDLLCKQWTTLNHLRTGVGRFGASLKKWGLKSTSACECGVPELTVDHIIDDCPHHRPPNREQGLADLDDGTRTWLASTKLSI